MGVAAPGRRAQLRERQGREREIGAERLHGGDDGERVQRRVPARRTELVGDGLPQGPHVDEGRIIEAIREVFDLRPAAIVRDLELLRPIYSATATYGHFGRELPDFTWERLDRVDALRTAAGL